MGVKEGSQVPPLPQPGEVEGPALALVLALAGGGLQQVGLGEPELKGHGGYWRELRVGLVLAACFGPNGHIGHHEGDRTKHGDFDERRSKKYGIMLRT